MKLAGIYTIQQHLTLLSLTVYIFNMRGPSKEQAGKRDVEAFLKLKLTRTLFLYVNFLIYWNERFVSKMHVCDIENMF